MRRIRPVVLGVGTVTHRAGDIQSAREPIDLMIDAARAAIADAGVDPAAISRIYVPRGRWRYRDPGRLIARRLGFPDAVTVMADVGVLQQSLIADACERVAGGDDRLTLVVGGEAGHRLGLYAKSGTEAPETEAPGTPDQVWQPAERIRIAQEIEVGLGDRPLAFYACLENAYRARLGRSIREHDLAIAELLARMSEVAARNPDAWIREVVPASAIATPSDRNRPLAFPYNRLHASNWSVDQAAALLFGGSQRDRPGEVFVAASSVSNFMLPTSRRGDLTALPSAGIAGRAALDAAGLTIDEIDLLDLYSCFPIAVELYADELKVPAGRDLTITGGMMFGGGPYNNYVLQSTAKAVELLRSGKGETALISSVSGVLTKQGFGIYTRGDRAAGFRAIDVTDQVAAVTESRELADDYAGIATVAAYTVLNDRGSPQRAVAIADVADGRRVLAFSEDADAVAECLTQEACGRRVDISAGCFRFAPGGAA